MSGFTSYRRKGPAHNAGRPTKLFQDLRTYLPPSTVTELRELSEQKRISMSRLVAYAVDNELEEEFPFEFNCSEPERPYVEHEYSGEASKLLDFLTAQYELLAIDSVVLYRKEIGVPDRESMVCAIRELLECNMVELVRPKDFAKNQKYDLLRPISGIKKKLSPNAGVVKPRYKEIVPK